MRLRQLWLVIGIVVGACATSSAQAPFAQSPKKDPYRNLFASQNQESKRLQERAAKALAEARANMPAEIKPKPQVLCGTLIVQADPTIDPKIRVAPPKDGAQYKLRIVPTPLCKPEQVR
jgi:hypothetical protein